MSHLATQEMWSVFDARRVKAPELRGLDSMVNGVLGWFKNRRPVLKRLKEAADRVDKLEPEIHGLSSSRLKEEVSELRDLSRLGRLEGPAYDRAFAVAREAALRGWGERP